MHPSSLLDNELFAARSHIYFLCFLSLCWICYNIASVLCFGHKAGGILALQSGVEPAPLALEGEVLTTGPTAKSQDRISEGVVFAWERTREQCAHFGSDAKNRLIGEDPDAGTDWGQEEKGVAEDGMRWLHGFTDSMSMSLSTSGR